MSFSSMNVQQLFAIVLIFGATAAEKNDKCTTPKGTSGTCVPLNTCEVVFKAASAKNHTARNFVKASYCGYDNEPLVCCESPGPVIEPNFETEALPDKTVCGLVKEERRLYLGKTADIGEFPWMVAIEYESKHESENLILCGGSLINNRYVLTSAHCLGYGKPNLVSVRLGELKKSTDPDCKELLANVECADPVQKIPIKEVIPHPLFGFESTYNDIGLILLDQEIQFTDYISPICLPSPNIPPPELGTYMTASGWGEQEYGKPYSSNDLLRKVKILLVPNEKCGEKLEGIGSQYLCGKDEELENTCSGAIVGPLVRTAEDKVTGGIRWYQEGVDSVGAAGCGNGRNPEIYTRITTYMAWIINVISED